MVITANILSYLLLIPNVLYVTPFARNNDVFMFWRVALARKLSEKDLKISTKIKIFP